IRIAGAERRAFASWASSFIRARREAIRARQVSVILTMLQAAVPLAGWLLVVSVVAGDISLKERPAELLAFSASFQFLLSAALQMSGFFLACVQVLVLAARMRPVLAAAPESRIGRSDPGQLSGRLEVRDLSFRYDAGGIP